MLNQYSKKKINSTRKKNNDDFSFINEADPNIYEPGDIELSSEKNEHKNSYDTKQHSLYLLGIAGPQRSDDRIKKDIYKALERNPEIDSSDIEISIKDGIVALIGTVDNFLMKRESETAAAKVPGVKKLFNHLHIQNTSQEKKSLSKGNKNNVA